MVGTDKQTMKERYVLQIFFRIYFQCQLGYSRNMAALPAAHPLKKLEANIILSKMCASYASLLKNFVFVPIQGGMLVKYILTKVPNNKFVLTQWLK